MKTVMIIDHDEKFSQRIQETIKDENITILTAKTNRSALQQQINEKQIDLFLISNPSSKQVKEFFACKSTASLSSPIQESNQILFEDCSKEELRTVINNNL
ncbi:MAG: response regulator [Candidatus Thermoplasmatota archaeon]|nr:response regulator [Candidatus Thermoplasmatota archaeon]MBS3802014.1 response regulator [Candidatus Thermoplasmatota archaeon]